MVGESVLVVCSVVVNVGAQRAARRGDVQILDLRVDRATWMPRLFSSASRTASSTVSRRTCGAWRGRRRRPVRIRTAGVPKPASGHGEQAANESLSYA